MTECKSNSFSPPWLSLVRSRGPMQSANAQPPVAIYWSQGSPKLWSSVLKPEPILLAANLAWMRQFLK